MTINLETIKDKFYNRTHMSNTHGDEDNIKINTYSSILEPLLDEYSSIDNQFQSEHTYFRGGRSDGTVATLAFEYKKSNAFQKQSYIDEALYGRKQGKNDSGLYQYLIDSIVSEDNTLNDTIFDNNGVGFDGYHWIFARFEPSTQLEAINVHNTRFDDGAQHVYQARFVYHVTNFMDGLKELVTLIKSTNKIPLSKETLTSVFRPSSIKVRDNVIKLYDIIIKETNSNNGKEYNRRVDTLYKEWLRSFGTMFGEEDENTDFNSTAKSIADLYHLDTNTIDAKHFLFALQTYFDIVLKILISDFLQQAKSPVASIPMQMSWSELTALFQGDSVYGNELVENFFEIHYYEWFTFAHKEDSTAILEVVNTSVEQLSEFDMATFKVRPESVHDVLQEVYMNLIPDKVRHLLGEYFSPDWIVEFMLDRIGYSSSDKNLINKKIIDPTAGSGAFILQALKRLINANTNNQKTMLTNDEVKQITANVVGFDLNPISSISAKANYILTLFSATDVEALDEPLNIPIYITDSVLSPIVYSEEGADSFTAKTSVGTFTIPKFDTFQVASDFMNDLSKSIDNKRPFNVFWAVVGSRYHFTDIQKPIINDLYEFLMVLHTSSEDSFWPMIIKNSFAPVLLKQQFDFVIGNPPWIAWKAMSKTYRQGTLKVWQSYGIFEKNAYDKKTTHDDFGMAVTYVALDQYLKDEGKLMFLLPRTFIKSTKGGQGFRKLKITRQGQDIPVKVLEVNDFNDVKIFHPKHTVPTISLLVQKGQETQFPMTKWKSWTYVDDKMTFQAHDNWQEVKDHLTEETLSATPVDSQDLQSAWLTMTAQSLNLAQNMLSNGEDPNYKARKGIEPAGAKGVYILEPPVVDANNPSLLHIVNDMSRQRRKDIKDKGAQPGLIEAQYVYPMLGGRNIQRWQVVSSEYMLVPHDSDHPYGLSEETLAQNAPMTYEWLEYYKDGLLASRIQSGKFFDPDKHPWYRLDNVGDYMYSQYKVLWKEQTKSFSAVAVGSYLQSVPNADLSTIGGQDKPIVVDSKVLLLPTDTFEEALFVTGILNAPTTREIIDSYAVELNRGIDVVKYIKLPTYDENDAQHQAIVEQARNIQDHVKAWKADDLADAENDLDTLVAQLFTPATNNQNNNANPPQAPTN